jgi:hypothetical protein
MREEEGIEGAEGLQLLPWQLHKLGIGFFPELNLCSPSKIKNKSENEK